ncbi:MAG: class II fructose-bisphosphate aldolase [Oscillospiraceae bacterium]
MALVTTTEMFKKAYDGGYAIGAFNVNNMEIVQGITEACQEQKAPVIFQVSKGARTYANHTYLVKLVEGRHQAPDIPIVPIGAASGPWPRSLRLCKACVDGGFTSVMIDGSSKPFEENIEITRKVVEYAHDHGVVVEAELGTLAGIEDDVKVAARAALHPSGRGRRVRHQDRRATPWPSPSAPATALINLSPSSAPATKPPPPLRFDVLEEVSRRLPGFPIVLHGSSSVPQEYVKMINENGGKMPDAIGIPEEELRHAAELSVCKINIDSDLRLAMTGTIRQFFNEHPDKFDPREYLKARPCQHQGARPPQAARRPRLRRQGLIGSYRIAPHRGAIFLCLQQQKAPLDCIKGASAPTTAAAG